MAVLSFEGVSIYGVGARSSREGETRNSSSSSIMDGGIGVEGGRWLFGRRDDPVQV